MATKTPNRQTNVQFLQAQLDVLQAQNTRLSEENNRLRHKLNLTTNDQRSASVINVEARLKAHQLEDERDRLCESLEKLKKKYSKLHEAFVDKVRRCKAFEETFRRQTTLNGLVQKKTLPTQKTESSSDTNIENLTKKIEHFQVALDEAHDIIDELEFELESVEFLEFENQRLHKELIAVKNAKDRDSNLNEAPIPSDGETLPGYDSTYRGAAAASCNMQRASIDSVDNESYVGDDLDAEVLERAALTQSLIKNAEADSVQMRRELLKSRLQNKRRTLRISRA